MKFSDLESGNFSAGPDDKQPQFVGVDAGLRSEVIIPEVVKGNLDIDDKGPTSHPQKLTVGLGSVVRGTVKSPPGDASDRGAAVLESSNMGTAHVAEGQNTVEDGIVTPRSILSKKKNPGISSSSRADGFEMQKKISFGKKNSKCDMSNVTQELSQTPLCETARHRPMRQFSQPLHTNANHNGVMHGGQNHPGAIHRCSSESSVPITRKGNYYHLRTKSPKFERPVLQLQSKVQGEKKEPSKAPYRREPSKSNVMPAGRYFDALKGPELEILKDSEELLLPLDQKWPFLLRFPIGCFGITLGLGSQAVLWKTLATSSSTSYLHIPLAISFILWCLALVALVIIFTIYSLKCLHYFEAVRLEYYHPVRINFFFAPWIACMFLAIGVPPSVATSVHPALWCLFIAPIIILELKIYGQWLSGGERRLSKVANPSTHLSLVGNFVGSILASEVGWKEPALFLLAVGSAHYLVLFVTLYQRLTTSEVLPKELHPVFFLFVAAPSAASVSWKYIMGDFDRVSRIAYFLGLFLYASLAVRLNFFRGFQFSIAWWAYTFPMTASAIATVHYSLEIKHPVTQVLSVVLTLISAGTVFCLFVCTIVHGLFWGTLFPNDMVIAITDRRRKRKHKGLNADLSNGLTENKGDSLGNELFVKNSLTNEDKALPESTQIALLSVKSDPVTRKEAGSDVDKPL